MSNASENVAGYYEALLEREAHMVAMHNPTGTETHNEKSLDTIVSVDAIQFVREKLILEYGNDLARAFFSVEKRNTIESHIRRYIMQHKLQVNGLEIKDQSKMMIDEIVGLGPIDDLLHDDSITEIMINGHKEVIVDKSGVGMVLVPIQFEDEEHLLTIARKMLNLANETVNEAHPICDARLPDSRINIVIAPVARTGTTITIRKFPPVNMTEEKMLESGLMIKDMLNCLKLLVRGGANILLCGGTGTGKTTLLKRLCEEIPDKERTITLEDTEEMRLKELYPKKHIVSLECRFTDKENTNIDLGRLLKATLRMYPSRVIVGEVRSKEAFDLVEILNTGHDGGMSSLHANSAKDAMTRVNQMIMRNGLPLGVNIIGKMVATAFDIIIFVDKLVDGTRRVKEIVEVLGFEDESPIVNHLYKFEVTDTAVSGGKMKIIGEHVVGEKCEFSPNLVSKLLTKGISREEMSTWIKKIKVA
ncbi:CpaF family protein [Paenibacillus sp. Leaf72]|uniref:CpaF family protein n=1 Tax=Paenibacillus sp. Leaf72 TaxID=1736234 RepID=UPI0006F5611C|nr:ATPase, T2SS/T4P/T4SS family [Paenibacillus sp. Leaf72]KQN97023.1 hypothetical protein ASF12_23425 [Paenibacillus sp. Leaf72]